MVNTSSKIPDLMDQDYPFSQNNNSMAYINTSMPKLIFSDDLCGLLKNMNIPKKNCTLVIKDNYGAHYNYEIEIPIIGGKLVKIEFKHIRKGNDNLIRVILKENISPSLNINNNW